MNAVRALAARFAHLEMDAALQVLKTDRLSFGVERDDFAVEDERLLQPLRPCAKRGGNFRKLRGFFVAEPRPEPDGSAPRRDFGDGPDAVVLRFVDEVGIDQWRVGERREHGAGDRGRGHASIMARRPEIFFGFEPVVEIRAVFSAAFEIPLVGPQRGCHPRSGPRPTPPREPCRLLSFCWFACVGRESSGTFRHGASFSFSHVSANPWSSDH